MERPAAAHNTAEPTAAALSISAVPEKQKQPTDKDIIFSYVHLSADYYAATESYPDWEQLQNLYQSGYADLPPAEVYRILRDEELNDELEVLHMLTGDEVARRRTEEGRDRTYLRARAHATTLPEELKYKIAWDIRKSGNNVYGRLTDELVDDDELIRRSLVYRAAKELLADKVVAGEVSEPRLTDLVLGMRKSGKRLSSFETEIMKSDNSLTPAQIEGALHTPWEDFAKPDEVKTFKTAIQQGGVARRNRGERERVVNALPYLDEELAQEVNAALDTRDGKLILGQYAIEFARKLPGGSNVADVRALLVSERTKLPFADKARFLEFTEAECRKYGNWLIMLLDGTDTTLNVDVIERGAQMGLGPGIGGIQARYNGSLIPFYADLGLAKKNAHHQFDGLGIDEIIVYINSVATLHNGKVSEAILSDHYRQMKSQGVSVPSPQTLMRVSDLEIGELFELAGHKVIQRKSSAEACAVAAAAYYRRTGKMPNSRDLVDPDMPSWPTVRRYCGNLANLHNLAMTIIENGQIPTGLLPNVELEIAQAA